MKLRKLLTLICGALVFSAAACSSSDASVVKYATVPEPVKAFMSKNFPGSKITTVVSEADRTMTEYDIYLSDGTKVEINADGTWEEVSNRMASVPVTLLPASAQTYLATNYAGQKVVKIDKDRKGYEVKLANGLELKFNTAGAFIKIDD